MNDSIVDRTGYRQFGTIEMERLSNTLRTLPGATALFLSGSRARARDDAYSDIDLCVVVHHIEQAIQARPRHLLHFGPIEVAVQFDGGSAYAILWDGVSYDHKVDIGLADARDLTDVARRTETGLCLWSQPPLPLVRN